MPEGAVYVGRPTRWGNPFRAGDTVVQQDASSSRSCVVTLDAQAAVDAFRQGMVRPAMFGLPSVEEVREHLRGHDLVCWCPLDKPCHADVLLHLANEVSA